MKSLIIVEHKEGYLKNINFEIATVLKKNGLEVEAILLGENTSGIAQNLGNFGVTKAYCVEKSELNSYSQDLFAFVISEFLKTHSYYLIAGGTSPFGKDLLPRLAAKLNVGMISDCVQMEKTGDKLVAKRPHFAGKCLSKAEFLGNCGIFSIRPNSTKAVENKVSIQVEKWNCEFPSPKAKVLSVQKGKSTKVDLPEASYIVSGGRAMANGDNFKILHELADVIGATVGASRAAVDSGYVPHSMQVGQTGKTVNPVLYIACGISGAIQHLAGMRTSKVIVAINKDPEAPLFTKADYGIVGDLFTLVPLIKDEFKKLLDK